MNVMEAIFENIEEQRNRGVKDSDLVYILDECEATILLYELADVLPPTDYADGHSSRHLRYAAKQSDYSYLEKAEIYGCRLILNKAIKSKRGEHAPVR